MNIKNTRKTYFFLIYMNSSKRKGNKKRKPEIIRVYIFL